MFTSNVQAADVVCACDGEASCSDVKISFVPSNPGVYMSIEYAYGERNKEGFATVTRDDKDQKVIYRLDNFTLVEQDNKFSLPGRPSNCN